MDGQLDISYFFESKEAMRSHFQDAHLTRQQVADFLCIDRTTIWRWENEIIKSILIIGSAYQTKTTHLCRYQRFILIGILALRRGLVEQKPYTYEEVKNYLKKRQINLTVQQFENWIGEMFNG